MIVERHDQLVLKQYWHWKSCN